ncbi:hypothetical protein CWI42_010030 [Ordospora colligata]|nr:hypothetical protein CWI42_010030 [Ordospora colligata]
MRPVLSESHVWLNYFNDGLKYYDTKFPDYYKEAVRFFSFPNDILNVSVKLIPGNKWIKMENTKAISDKLYLAMREVHIENILLSIKQYQEKINNIPKGSWNILNIAYVAANHEIISFCTEYILGKSSVSKKGTNEGSEDKTNLNNAMEEWASKCEKCFNEKMIDLKEINTVSRMSLGMGNSRTIVI